MRGLRLPLALLTVLAGVPGEAAGVLGRTPVRAPSAGAYVPAVSRLSPAALHGSLALSAPSLSPLAPPLAGAAPLAPSALAELPPAARAAADAPRAVSAERALPADSPLPSAPVAGAALVPAAEAAASDDMPVEQRAAQAGRLFDAALPAAADAPQPPSDPEPGFSKPLPLLFGRPSTRLGRAGAAVARVTGAAYLLRAYRESFVLQKHAARLQDQSAKPVKRAVSARVLAEIGAVEAAPLLGWALEHDPSPRVRRVAAQGLLLMAEHSAPKLTRRLRNGVTAAGREGAATALGWLAAHAELPEALQALGTAAVLDPSDSVRLSAVRSLGRAEGARAVKLLFWVQAHATRPGLRAAVEQALREHAERSARNGVQLYQPPADEFGEVSSPLQASALKRSIAVGLTFAALEFAGGVWTNNAALRADALHLAGDRLLDATGLFALYLGRRPPSARRTYGFIKAEAVFALLGALAIAGIALGMAPDVWHGLLGVYSWVFAGGPALAAAGWGVAGYALLGLASNLFSGFLLSRHREGSMTTRAAFLHVMADAMGSAGIILSTALGALFGWTFLQPFVLAAIVYLILHTAWELGTPAWNVLMDAVPPGMDLDALERDFTAVPGVTGVYDLHVRLLNGSSAELAAKALVRDGADRDAVLAELQKMLREKHKITHATIQLERAR